MYSDLKQIKILYSVIVSQTCRGYIYRGSVAANDAIKKRETTKLEV